MFYYKKFLQKHSTANFSRSYHQHQFENAINVTTLTQLIQENTIAKKPYF